MTRPMTESFTRSRLALHILFLGAAVFVGTAIFLQPAGAQQNRGSDNAELQVLPVQGNVHMIVGAGANVTVQVGEQGVVLVDTGSAQLSGKTLAAIRTLSKRPIRYIVNTTIDPDHTGGNASLSQAGITVLGVLFQSNVVDALPGAIIVGHENAYNRMSGLTGSQTPAPAVALPQDNYSGDLKKLYFNDEGIEIIHIGGAHTDADSMVFFRRSDVVSAGDYFSTTSYPVIDLAKGGGIQGILGGLNSLLNITIAKQEVEGGTYVIPGHGRISDQFDVVEYRDLVTIIRDRIQVLIKKGLTLEQIKATRPTEDYDARYGATSGPWTTDMFVEAVYQSLLGKK